MNKYIKQLVESFFDDMFDEKDEEQKQDDSLLGDITDTQETTNDLLVKAVFKAMDFTECKTEQDLVDAFLDKDTFLDWYNNNIEKIIAYFKNGGYFGHVDYNKAGVDFNNSISYDSYYKDMIIYTMPTTNELYIKFGVEEQVYNQLTLKVITMYFYETKYTSKPFKSFPIHGYHVSKQRRSYGGPGGLRTSAQPKQGPSKRTLTIENSFNTSDVIFNAEMYKDCIKNYFLKFKKFGHEVLKQNNHDAVTYTISQKDIDRMVKCQQTHKYAGFSAITKLDKLIPRWAAGLYVNDNYKNFKFNDYTLTKWCNKKFPLSGDVNDSMLDKVYLKDILATLEAYK